MHSAWLAFKECGWASFLCLLIGLAGAAAGLVAVVLLATRTRNAAAIVGAVAVALGLAALGAGLLGRQTGLSKVEAAIEGDYIDSSQKARIRAVGLEEANQCINVGAAAGALPFMMGALAVAIGLATRKKAEGAPR